MLPFVGLLCHTLALQPGASISGRALPGVSVSRRALLVAPFAVGLLPAHADDAEDKLVVRLDEVRARLVTAQSSFDAEEWDDVRGAVKVTLEPLTLKGYLGDSVKARATALGEEKGATLKAQRMELLTQLSGLDGYCYQRQTNGAKKLEVAEARALPDGSVTSLDKVIATTRAAK